MTDDTMKALDEIEAALKSGQRVMAMLIEHGPGIVPHLMDTDDNAGEYFRQYTSAALSLLPTLRAALTPPADDEVSAIRARHEASDPKWQLVGTLGVQAHTDRATLLRAVDRLSAELARAKERIVKLETPTLQWNPDSPETPIESVESLAEHFADYGHPCGVFEVQNAHELPYTYHFYNVMVDNQELDDDDPIETYEVVCLEITKEEYRAGLAAAAIGWFAKRAKWATDRAATQHEDTP